MCGSSTDDDEDEDGDDDEDDDAGDGEDDKDDDSCCSLDATWAAADIRARAYCEPSMPCKTKMGGVFWS